MDENRRVSAEIILSKNGAAKIIGNFEIVGIDGKALTTDFSEEVYLCTCGRSKRKPFCDESHKI
ncbi:MAG: CDGSH iron-sulfur domain-containing protein [Bacteroidales bacterium]|nr:CDGSH iron-sulfur domain-containing protein [Bacteroidales bacterium]